MKLAKSLLLGSAAGLVAVAGAQAADLPVRAAAPVDYVRTCPNAPIGGTGFFVIPGTETCLRISGYVRADYAFAQEVDAAGLDTRAQNRTGFWVRGRLNFDARTPTEYGTLRSFIRIHATAGDAQTAYTARVDRIRNNDAVVLDQAFIQFGGLTAGRITSFFDFYAFGDLMSIAAFNSGTTTEVLAYTATFGNGFSATLSLENTNRRNTGPAGRFGGQEWPDVVANLNVTQAWGSAQIMGALHNVRAGVGTPLATDDEIGFAVGAGVNILLPMLAAGDNIWLTATYTDGALAYLGPLGNTSQIMESIWVGGLADAYVNATGTGFNTTTAWGIAAGFTHYWTPTIWQSINGSYGEVDVPRIAEPAPGTITVAGGTTQDFTIWNIGTRLNWRPASGITFSADVGYTQINTDFNVVTPATTVAGDDTDGIWAGRIRIQRDF